jgi:hypothetical protein
MSKIRNELRRAKKNCQEDFGSILSRNPELEGYLQSVRGRPKGVPRPVLWTQV